MTAETIYVRLLLTDYMSSVTSQSMYSASHTVTKLTAGVTEINLVEQSKPKSRLGVHKDHLALIK